MTPDECWLKIRTTISREMHENFRNASRYLNEARPDARRRSVLSEVEFALEKAEALDWYDANVPRPAEQPACNCSAIWLDTPCPVSGHGTTSRRTHTDPRD